MALPKSIASPLSLSPFPEIRPAGGGEIELSALTRACEGGERGQGGGEHHLTVVVRGRRRVSGLPGNPASSARR